MRRVDSGGIWGILNGGYHVLKDRVLGGDSA